MLVAGLLLRLAGVIIGAPTLRLKSDYLALVTLGSARSSPRSSTTATTSSGTTSPTAPRASPRSTHGTGLVQTVPGVPATSGRSTTPTSSSSSASLAAFCRLRLAAHPRRAGSGRAWLAIREDELAASMMGVPLMRTKLAAYAVGAFVGGVGGVAFATHVNGVLADRFNFSISIIAAGDGGARRHGQRVGRDHRCRWSSPGSTRPACRRSARPSTTRSAPTINFPSYRLPACSALILVLMMLFRREGLFPETRTRRCCARPDAGTEAEEPTAEPTWTTSSRRDGEVAATAADRATAAGAPAAALRAATSRSGSAAWSRSTTSTFTIPEGGDRQPDRAQRRRKDDVLQRPHRPLQARRRARSCSATATSPACPRTRSPRWGLARTFQNIRLFGLMTADENVMVAMHSHMKAGRPRHRLRACPGSAGRSARRASSLGSCSTSSASARRADEYARNLSYGDQRRLEIARALALRPKVLLLDEPTAGMNPQESARFVEFVHEVRDERKVSVLLIEHDMSVVMRVSERITVLDRGEKIAEGGPDEIRNNQRVVEAYLGKTGTEGARDDHRRRRRHGDPAGTRRGEPMLERRGPARLLRQHRRREGPHVRGRRRARSSRSIGSNGAGKSTTLRTISGLLRPAQGRDHVQGRARSAASRGPRDRQARHLPVAGGPADLPAHDRRREPRPRRVPAQGQGRGSPRTRERVLDLFPRLGERINQKAGTMSGGEQQMLAVGRAHDGPAHSCCCSTSRRWGWPPCWST